MTRTQSGLSDKERARYAWARYRRLMAWMTLAASLAVVGALVFLRATVGEVPLHMMLATIGGVGASVLLGAALMGLVFLSSGTGHDETIEDPFKEDE